MRNILQFFKSTRAKAVELQDYDSAVGLNRMVLDLIGIWPDEKTFTVKASKRFHVPLMLLSVFIWFAIPAFYALIQVMGILTLVTDNLMCNVVCLCSMSKIYVLWRGRKILQGVIKMINENWRESIKVPWEKKLMSDRANMGVIFSKLGHTMMVANCLSTCILPPFDFSYRTFNNLTDPYENYVLPLQTYYPFDWGWSPLYELIYGTQVLAASFMAICLTVPDFLFGVLVFHACASCEILEGHFRALLNNEDYIRKLSYQRFKKELGTIVEKHLRFIRFTNDVEDIFSVISLVQVVCLGLCMCIFGFEIMASLSNKNEGLQIVHIAISGCLLTAFIIHLFVYCYSSEILLNCCDSFSDAIYCSRWYSLPPKYRKDLILVMIRAKHPLELSAGKFMNLSFNTFLKIIKTSAGYVSVLLALNQ